MAIPRLKGLRYTPLEKADVVPKDAEKSPNHGKRGQQDKSSSSKSTKSSDK